VENRFQSDSGKEKAMKFLTQLNDTAPDKWREVEADSEQSAAFQALRLASVRQLCRVEKLLPCIVWVEDQKTPRHENGTPFCVHRFEMVKPEGKV
jgi:hypothetical protein